VRALATTRPGKLALLALALISLLTAVGFAILWPSGERDDTAPAGLTAHTERAEVVSVASEPCPGQPSNVCGTLDARLSSGDAAGQTVTIELGTIGADPGFSVGDGIRVTATDGPTGRTYAVSDFERGAPMLWLAIAFAALVLVFGRLRGALSLVGLALSLLVVLVYIVPAIQDGSSALAVALTGSLAVMLVTIALAHGLGVKSVTAMLGTALSLLLVVGLASAFTEWTHLTGLSSEEASFLAGSGSDISFQGLLLAGMVIGSLGVLDDVTVSQASTVMAIRAADPGLSARELYGRAIEVGRDHVSATVNTLVLAYVGASLPVLLIFSASGVGLADAINVELVAKEVVAMLVGSIGLIAAVPLTTLLAATLAVRVRSEALDADLGHVH